MEDLAGPVARLIEEFKKFPGIGPKSAQRLVFSLVRRSAEDCTRLAQAIVDLKQQIRLCSDCNNIADVDPCHFCSNPSRNHQLICVVEEPFNVYSIEKTRDFRGVYHVLHGALSPINGIGPEDLKIKNLLVRIQRDNVEEVILATNPNIEGEATAIYLSRLLKPLGMRVTRIALGIPVGSDLEYADEVTLSKALAGRREME
ncbi:MAG TPA: recombination mediator RecR [Acidobacteriota bacterium]|jgi:recombination protein RecR|nr:recombination mediator RecR [Acidobacteriota bacterium]